MGNDQHQIRVIIAGGGVVGLVLANALEVREMMHSEIDGNVSSPVFSKPESTLSF